jgi:hypothetical protein
MYYAIEIGSGAMMFLFSFMKIVGDIQKKIRGTLTESMVRA